jgi:hypothetical protein
MERDTGHIDDPDFNANDREVPGAGGEDVESPDDYEDVYDEEEVADD